MNFHEKAGLAWHPDLLPVYFRVLPKCLDDEKDQKKVGKNGDTEPFVRAQCEVALGSQAEWEKFHPEQYSISTM